MRLPEISPVFIGTRLLPGLFVVAAILHQAPASGDAYKWTGPDGEIHYTQARPPRGVAAERIEGARAPADNPGELRKDLQKQLDSFNERTEEAKEVDTGKQREVEIAEIFKKNCTSARDNLAKLQRGGPIRYQTDDGGVVRLTEEDRQQRITTAQGNIEKYCTPGAE